MGRRGYPPELRHRALTMVATGRSVFQVATELGVSVPAIYAWRAQARRDAELPPDATANEPDDDGRAQLSG